MAQRKNLIAANHVNVARLVTLTMEDHVDSGDHQGVVKHNPKIKFRDFASIDNAPEERERGITIATAHVEYETAKTGTMPTWIAGSRRLHQEHELPAQPRWMARFSSSRHGRPDARRRVSTFFWPARLACRASCGVEQCDAVDDAELLTW